MWSGKSSRAGQKWRSKEESIRSNLRQYGVEHLFIDVLVADASRHALWRQHEFLDAIVADRESFLMSILKRKIMLLLLLKSSMR